MSAVSGAAALTTIARFYDGTGYTGATFTVAHQNGPCTTTYADTDYWYVELGSFGWNNRISSVRTYNRCDIKLYDGTNFSGAVSVWIDASSNLSGIGTGWNNRASSVKFS